MKTPEELIIEKVGEYWWICGKHRPEFIAAAIEFGNQMYNQAVDDVCQRARLKTVSSSGNINTTSQEFHAYNTVVSVDVDSLKRLKKSVVSTD